MARREFGLHKVGKYWHMDFWVDKIHIHRSTKATVFEDALSIARKAHAQARRAAEGLPVDTEILVEDLWKDWWEGTELTLSESHRDRVERDWRLHILPMFTGRKARSITTEDAEDLRTAFLAAPSQRNAHHADAKLRRLQGAAKRAGEPIPQALPETDPLARSMASANKLLLHFSLVFAWHVQVKKSLAAVPFTVHVKDVQGKPKATLTRELVPSFLANVDARGSLHVQVAVRAELYLPLREREALRLRWEWFSRDLATFQHGERKKKDAPAFPVPADLQGKLHALIPEGQEVPTAGLVLPAEDGQPHRQQFTRKAITAAGKALGLHLTPHSMRHSWATMTARATGSAHLVKDGLGHKTMDQAIDYVKLNTSDLQAAQAQVFGELATGVKEIPSQNTHKLIKKYLAKIRK